MSFGIYKPGQGYWVRTMSAVFLGVLFLVGAAWAWDQAGAAPVPARAYDFTVSIVDGQPQGEAIVLLERMGAGQSFEVIGTATSESYNASTDRTGKLVVKDLSYQVDGMNYTNISRVRSEDPGMAFTATVQRRTAIPLIPRLYLQAGVAGFVILLGAVAVFWFTGSNKKMVDFLVATDGEMKKVNWSTKKEIIGSTQVVIVAAVLISLILFLIDIGFSNFFRMIGVLES
jgi:preprotein translocase SecE subunit